MAIESLMERFGARKHERLAGFVFPCGHCSSEIYKKPFECEVFAHNWTAPEKPSAGTGKVFCSKDCYHGFWDQHRRQLPCLNCGKEVVRPPSHVLKRERVFCSTVCKNANGLIEVPCTWPGCTETMTGRKFHSRRLGAVWKTDLRKHGVSTRWPLCSYHIGLIKEHLPDRNRLLNGKFKWFSDPSADYGTRGVTRKAVKLMVWAKTKGHCADCGCDLDFGEKPQRWHCDHVVPVFKGGTTTYWNLMPLCQPCHNRKSAVEKSEASKSRHRENKARRWLTHPQKDALIAELRAEIEHLRRRLGE